MSFHSSEACCELLYPCILLYITMAHKRDAEYDVTYSIQAVKTEWWDAGVIICLG